MAPIAPVRLAWIEACRGVAATAVLYDVARHLDANYGIPPLKAAFQFGHAGVDLFFVISGVIILLVHFDDVGNSARLQRYAGRRITRVLPLYWIADALTIAKRSAAGHGLPLGGIGWAVLPVPTVSDPVFGVAWMLQYEFVFYVAFGALTLNRLAGAALMVTWLAVVVVTAGLVDYTKVPAACLGLYNLEFFAGMAVAYQLHNHSCPRYKLILGAGIFLFVTTGIADDLGWLAGYGTITTFAYGLPSAFIVLGAAEASRRTSIRVPSILRTLGSASYSIYLFHVILLGTMWQFWLLSGLDKMVPPAASFVLFVSGAVTAGVVISRLVEYPLMGFVRGIFAKLWSQKAARIEPDVQY